MSKVLLAYSGGPSSSLILSWLLEQGHDVHVFIGGAPFGAFVHLVVNQDPVLHFPHGADIGESPTAAASAKSRAVQLGVQDDATHIVQEALSSQLASLMMAAVWVERPENARTMYGPHRFPFCAHPFSCSVLNEAVYHTGLARSLGFTIVPPHPLALCLLMLTNGKPCTCPLHTVIAEAHARAAVHRLETLARCPPSIGTPVPRRQQLHPKLRFEQCYRSCAPEASVYTLPEDFLS
eukprot:gene2513-3257_t